jgi:hypothetical protein
MSVGIIARRRSRARGMPLLALLPFVLLLAVSTASAAYDDGDGTSQCESHVYPLDGSTLKPVRTQKKKKKVLLSLVKTRQRRNLSSQWALPIEAPPRRAPRTLFQAHLSLAR